MIRSNSTHNPLTNTFAQLSTNIYITPKDKIQPMENQMENPFYVSLFNNEFEKIPSHIIEKGGVILCRKNNVPVNNIIGSKFINKREFNSLNDIFTLLPVLPSSNASPA